MTEEERRIWREVYLAVYNGMVPVFAEANAYYDTSASADPTLIQPFAEREAGKAVEVFRAMNGGAMRDPSLDVTVGSP